MSGMKNILLVMGIGMMAALAGCVANEDQNDLNDAGVDAENLISENVIDGQQAGLYEGDVRGFLETVTDDMLFAYDEVPSYEAFMNDPIVFLNRYDDDVYLYGIRTAEQEQILMYMQGERVVIDTAWGNLYAEPPGLNYADIDSDGAEEVIISNRTITGNVRQYELIVCDCEDTWNVYTYDDYVQDIENTIDWQYDDDEKKITIMDRDGNVLRELELPEWTEDYPFTGKVIYDEWMMFDAETMLFHMTPQFGLEHSLPYAPVEIIFEVRYKDGEFDLGDYSIQDTKQAESEDDGVSFSMEEVKALDIPEDMLAYWLVLNNKMPFVSYDEGNQEFYWDEYFWDLADPCYDTLFEEPSRFRIADMNNDGKNEIAVSCSLGAVRMLHYEDGVVYLYQFYERGMLQIYANGVYMGSSGAAYATFYRLTELNKDGYTEEILADAVYDRDIYEVGGITVSAEEFDAFYRELEEMGTVKYIDYTSEAVDSCLLGDISEEELYMLRHAAAEPMIDTAEYPMEPEVMRAYYEVLTNQKEFISVTDDHQMFYIDSYQERNGNNRGADEILYFSIVDMDRDGVYEVILTATGKTQILHYQDGNIYSYRYSYIDVGTMTNQGIFNMRSTYGENHEKIYHYGIIDSFDEDECVIEEVDYNGNLNDDRIRYYYFSEELIEKYFR